MVTHVLPRVELTVRRPDPAWAYLNAFLGSREYGELAVAHGVRLYVCGHVHYRRRVQAGGTTFLCNCLGYRTEWGNGADPAAEIERALRTVELAPQTAGDAPDGAAQPGGPASGPEDPAPPGGSPNRSA